MNFLKKDIYVSFFSLSINLLPWKQEGKDSLLKREWKERNSETRKIKTVKRENRNNTRGERGGIEKNRNTKTGDKNKIEIVFHFITFFKTIH